jgi:hypothetical protein
MMLFRYRKTSEYTLGLLVTGAGIFYTMEPPWKDNKRNESCIPPGEYEFSFMPKSSSGRYRNCYHIKGVPGRSEILIHTGNTSANTKGCILPGKRKGWLSGARAVLNSKSALCEINEAEINGTLRVI